MKGSPTLPSALTDFIDAASLQAIQDSLAAAAAVSVAFETPDGTPLTRPCPAPKPVTPAGSGEPGNPSPDEAHIVPIMVDQRPIARIVLGAANGVSTEAVEFANVLSRTLAKLCSEENQLRHRVDELSAVYEVTALLAGTYDVQTILDRTAAKVCEVMKVAACSIRLLADDRNELVIRAVHNLSDAYLNKGPVTVTHNPIDAEALAGRSVYVENAPEDPRTQYPAQARREGIVSTLAVGMMHQGRAVGVVRAYTHRRYSFSPYEVSLLRVLAAQVAAAIVNARLYRDAQEADRWARQMRYAGEIQRRMIPSEPPAHPAVEFGCAYAPTFEVGGDFYDFMQLPWGHLGIAIADVVGKGLPAALMMASLRSALRVYAHTVYELDEIIGHVNRHFQRDTLVSEFATLFYGVLTPDGRTLIYCNAGHNAPLLVRDGTIRELETGGMVLGVLRDTTFAKETVDLRPGDVLLLYTDGVIDALDFSGECFGEERLVKSLLDKVHVSANLIARDVLWDVRRVVGLAPQADDLTLMAMKVL